MFEPLPGVSLWGLNPTPGSGFNQLLQLPQVHQPLQLREHPRCRGIRGRQIEELLGGRFVKKDLHIYYERLAGEGKCRLSR